MNLHKLYLTKNMCYITGTKHTVKGIMVHSTGANNPRLSRYVGPDDGILGVNPNNNHWNDYRPGCTQYRDGGSAARCKTCKYINKKNKPCRMVCVHGFIGKTKDGSIATYQTLPFDIQGWHSAYGTKGSANRMGYVGFEVCEDGLTDKEYFKKVYRETVEFCAYICKLYKLNPLADGVIISHHEGYLRKIASNHGDIDAWLTKQGTNMNKLRADVAAELNKPIVNVVEEEEDVKPANLTIKNGVTNKNVVVSAVEINEENYIRLRDLEKLGSEVSWDAVEKMPAISTVPVNPVTLKVDGVDVNVNTINRNNTNHIAVRSLLEAIGYEVSWDEATKTIVANKK